jgi:plasmid stability protein
MTIHIKGSNSTVCPMTVNIPDEQEAALTARAQSQGVSVEQCAGQLLSQALESPARPPLAARIRGIWSDIPDSVRAKLPTDGASEHDHYIYGVPKRGQLSRFLPTRFTGSHDESRGYARSNGFAFR